MTKNNNLLGTFELTGIPPAPRGVPQIEVTFEIDVNGMLRVAAEDRGTGNKNRIQIESSQGRLSEEEVQRMLNEAEAFAEEDRKSRDLHVARSELEAYVYSLRNQLKDSDKLGGKLSKENFDTVEETVDKAVAWLDTHLDVDVDELIEQKNDIESIVNPIIKQLYENSSHEEL